MQVNELGRTGMQVTRIGFGGMTIPRVDEEQAVATVNKALDLGVNFIDTARVYGSGDSERKIGLVMKHRRKECFLSSRTTDMSYEGMKRAIDESLEALQTDYIDLYEPHDVSTREKHEQVMSKDGALRALKEARAEGKIGHVGVTGHNWALMAEMIRSGEFEAALIVYNLATRSAEDEVIDLAERHGVGLFVMKVFGNARLFKLSPPGSQRTATVEECLRFALSNPGLAMILTGAKSPEEIAQNVAVAEALSPLTDAEQRDLRAFGDRLRGGYCYDCRYCLPCPQEIDIPGILQLLDHQERLSYEWPQGRKAYAAFTATIEDCVDCGECEQRCPQNLPVRERLRKAHERLARPV
jgi:predicted aldo/keto reductase-like oxidoreductase